MPVSLPILDALLDRISERPAIRNHGLATLLDRYAVSARHARVHIGLRDTSLDAWGSPHLDRNMQWALVKTGVKTNGVRLAGRRCA